MIEAGYRRGLLLIEGGEFFEAHKVLEQVWRVAEPGERDFFHGLVHVAVAWYQAGRGNRRGCEGQLAKATRRLAPYAPSHRELDVSSLLSQLNDARRFHPDMPKPRLSRAEAGDPGT